MAKSKKRKQVTTPQNSETSVLHWYEQAGRSGYLDQKPNKKEAKEIGNPFDSADLDRLSSFKKQLEDQQAQEKKEKAAQVRQRAKEEEKNTHWFELAEKQGYLD